MNCRSEERGPCPATASDLGHPDRTRSLNQAEACAEMLCDHKAGGPSC
jgi:hypothetical protein